MLWLWGSGIALVLLFGFTILFGAPYLPTLKSRTSDALDMLDLKPGELLLELGSGDGRLQRAAAKRGIRSIGYELNPLLVIYSKIVLLKYRRLATVRLANYWQVRLPQAEGIYVFLLQSYMEKLHKKINNDFSTPVKLVSFGFIVPNKKPVRAQKGMYLYEFNTAPKKAGR